MGFSNGVYSRTYNWTNDANAGIDILPGRMDTEDNGFATGLSTCILKDGTQTVTANIPFAGFRLTGVGAATSRTDALQAAQSQDGGVTLCTVTGTANAIALATTPTTTNLATGRKLRFKATANSTAGITVSENSQTALNLYLPDGTTQAGNGNIKSGSWYSITYDSALNSNVGGYIIDANGNPAVLASQMPALTGDITTSAGAVATTLATVNSNVGSFTNASVTVNAKGLVTAASNGTGGIAVPRIQTFTTSGTYTPNANMLYCTIECWGGGGAGGGAAAAAGACGGGGGSGSYSKKTASAATIGASQTVTIGAAGTAGSGAGGNGGDTSVGTICVGKGGSGGAAGVGSTTVLGGAGGIAGTGDITAVGNHGSIGFGQIPSGENSGSGGTTSLMGGGYGQFYTADAAGISATANSGSGGGGAASNGTARNGGGGGSGYVYITEWCSA